jgi:ubiquinone biosynthesis protein UbiJ
LYEERELEKVRRDYAGRAEQGGDNEPAESVTSRASAAPRHEANSALAEEVATLRAEVADLKSQVASLRDEFQKFL